ncbi:MAG: NAD-dependent epimerase/dehydratase family protein [Ferruginibacter sp.]|nr:NAD-dependent epimerase/dehydratase family protein [Ferruginibacter sp.]
MHTILGAGGAIARELSSVLITNNQPVRLVGRNPKPVKGATTVAADLSNNSQTSEAVKGSSIVYLCVGLKYEVKIWAKNWPAIMQNTIDACKKHKAKLVFFDNIYCLGKVNGPMTEESVFNPNSKKGMIRAAIATQLLNEIKAGNLTSLIARSADFYGPGCKTSVFNLLITDKMVKGKKAQYLVNANQKHSFTYTPDCGKALWLLSQRNDAFNQTWHLPTAQPALTGKELISLAAKELGTEPNYTILSKGYIRFGGLFNNTVKELYEMLYQNESEYIFDSSKFENAFGIAPTSYEEGIKQTMLFYKK